MCITLGEIDKIVAKSLVWTSVLIEYEFHSRYLFQQKSITDNWKFRKKSSKTYAEALRSVGISNSGGEVLEQLKTPNVLKEENHGLNGTVGINLKSIYARFRKMTC